MALTVQQRLIIFVSSSVAAGIICMDAIPVAITQFSAESRANYAAAEAATAVRNQAPSTAAAITAYGRAQHEASLSNASVSQQGFRVNADHSVTLTYSETAQTHWFQYVPFLKDLLSKTVTVTHTEVEYASS